MTSVAEHLHSVDGVIFSNIEYLIDDRGLLSQNVLAQLRNLAEGVAVLVNTQDVTAEYDYPAIESGLAFLKSNGKLSFLSRFYRQLQPSTSHYTFDGDSAAIRTLQSIGGPRLSKWAIQSSSTTASASSR